MRSTVCGNADDECRMRGVIIMCRENFFLQRENEAKNYLDDNDDSKKNKRSIIKIKTGVFFEWHICMCAEKR